MEIFMGNILSRTPLGYLLSGDIQGFVLQVLYILPALVIAVSFHEAAHAWMANRMGDSTAKNLGRLTLDPTKHFTIWGVVAFLFIGIGWGKPVPTNPRNYDNYKKANVLVAISGITMNLILSFTFYLIYFLLFQVLGLQSDIIRTIIFYIIYLNIVLLFFNLIPIPPLDGHHLVKGFIARRSPKFYMYYQQYGFMVLLALLFLTDIVSTVLISLTSWVLMAYQWFFGLFI